MVNKFKLFCLSKGYTARKLSEEVEEKTGVKIAVSTVFAYFQGARTPNKQNMDALVSVLGDEVLGTFYGGAKDE